MRDEFLTCIRRSALSPARFAAALATCRFVVEGSSMEPALSEGQRLLIRRMNAGECFVRGDIVVAHVPYLFNMDYIKRIIGLPGEHVKIRGGRGFISDRILREPYLDRAKCSGAALISQWFLADDEYLVLGDRRGDSMDSRRFGPLSRENILGKAWFCYWPPSSWGWVPRGHPSL